MSNQSLAPQLEWLAQPLSPEVTTSLTRLRQTEDVVRVVVLPDVHLADKVCVGAVTATKNLLYPEAVGKDIGCGMAAVAVDADADALANESTAGRILAGLYNRVPWNKHARPQDLPQDLQEKELSHGGLQRRACREGRFQLGTLGRGNHFLELQADADQRLWLMVHSGSRAIGQEIQNLHLRHDPHHGSSLTGIEAASAAGLAYLADAAWARRYAAANRLAMLRATAGILAKELRAAVDWSTLLHSDHNHVIHEEHREGMLWVHRKGAQAAFAGQPGIIPGSMGTVSYHVSGRGSEKALCSCSHGAGRTLTRTEARRQVSTRELARQMGRVRFDHRVAAKLVEEAPSAYKDIRKVISVQRPLVRIVRELRPLLCYKGL